jgi:DNA-binding LacI/PurR family transcriptional regulator
VNNGSNIKNATIYDIAKRANTSPSTVGSVLNGTWKGRRISKKRAESIKKIADQMGYSVNMQASALRKERSHIIGMIVPMYDNRYFSFISQVFERKARERGLFPMVSCTLRDPELEEEAVRQMLKYQVERVICTGATDPDKISEICEQRNVPTLNLDLPGTKAPSVISDNYRGAYELTHALIGSLENTGTKISDNLLFIGGRSTDHNTKERLRGFIDANEERDMNVNPDMLLTCGYAALKAETALADFFKQGHPMPKGIFINSTISLEGVMSWFRKSSLAKLKPVALGCFDWDPFATFIGQDIVMVRQNVPEMMDKLFELIDADKRNPELYFEIQPTIIRT